MGNIMKTGNLITTTSGACGLIHRVTSAKIQIKWFTNDSGEPINEPLASYPVKDVEHSLKSGFLTLSDSNDPNVMFLMRKHNADS
jgi:hypothetical protein